jgi:hypothetical protein
MCVNRLLVRVLFLGPGSIFETHSTAQHARALSHIDMYVSDIPHVPLHHLPYTVAAVPCESSRIDPGFVPNSSLIKHCNGGVENYRTHPARAGHEHLWTRQRAWNVFLPTAFLMFLGSVPQWRGGCEDWGCAREVFAGWATVRA